MNNIKAQVRILDDRVEKQQKPTSAAIELYGTRMGRQIAAQCGHFHVPRVLESDAERGLIVLERILDAHSLRKVLPTFADPVSLISRVALALAAIHSLGEACAGSEATGFSHGDFSIDNLFYVESSNQLYVFDWSLPNWWMDSLEYGPYHDLSIFVMSLFARPVFYSKKVRDVSRLATKFFDVYKSNAEFDAQRMSREFKAVRSDFMPYSFKLNRLRFVANYPSTVRCKRFIDFLTR